MDILTAMLRLAEMEGIFEALRQRLPRLWASMYADDVVVFLKPKDREMRVIKELMDTFASASLHPNFSKSSIYAIRCDRWYRPCFHILDHWLPGGGIPLHLPGNAPKLQAV